MTTKAPTTKRMAELDEIASAVALPDGVTDIAMAVDHIHGSKIAGTELWSGLGGETRYGPQFIINGRERPHPPLFLGTMAEARYLFTRLAGEEGELWQRREHRRLRIIEIEAAEAAALAEAKVTAKEEKRLTRKGVNVKEATGGGSSRREPSSAKRSGSTRMRVEETSMLSAVG